MEARTMHDALRPNTDPDWTLVQRGFDPLRDGSRESRFAISNGFLGVRGSRSFDHRAGHPVTPRSYVAGLFDVVGADQPVPALVAVPDWLRLRLSLSTGASILNPEDVSFVHRTLDLRRGTLLSEGRLATRDGLAICLRVLRLVSMRERALGMQLVRMEVEAGDVAITVEASFDGLEFGLKAERLEQGLGLWRTSRSGRRLAIAAGLSLRLDGEVLAPEPRGPFRWAWSWTARPGQSVWFERMVALTRGDDDDDPAGDAQSRLSVARTLGWAGVIEEHEACWSQRWQDSDVTVGGDAAAQQALRFALYHLNGAANPGDPRVSIGARALTGADYHGHVFWDTEIFLLPFYTLTWPEAARTLLTYRFRTLDAARAKAAGMGCRGALYAWESADSGAETTPEHATGPDRRIVDILCGRQEQHISADIAYAVWQYWQVTADEDFLCDAGAEILLETARFWSSRARLEADGLHHVRGVIGPDEYHETIDDNAFTNVMARWNIRRAVEVAALLRQRWPACWDRLSLRIGLDQDELQRWSAVADTMATGLDPRGGLFEQFAGFFGLEDVDLAQYAGRSVPMDLVLGRERISNAQVVKQADVVALLALLPEEFGDKAAANFDYYEPRCSHGSSLSRAMHGLAAARLGRPEMALRFFRQSSAIDLADTLAAIDGGVHIAALGGIWMMAVLGFAGLSPEEDGIRLDPQLPDAWDSLGFVVRWRSRRVKIGIDRRGRMIEAILQAGEPMRLTVGETRHALRREEAVSIAFSRKGAGSEPG